MPKPNPSFFNRNMVAIIMLPSIIGIHYGWSLLQNNTAMVKEEEKIEMPIITFGKYAWQRLCNLGGSEQNSSNNTLKPVTVK